MASIHNLKIDFDFDFFAFLSFFFLLLIRCAQRVSYFSWLLIARLEDFFSQPKRKTIFQLVDRFENLQFADFTVAITLSSNKGRTSESLQISSWMIGLSSSSQRVLKKNLCGKKFSLRKFERIFFSFLKLTDNFPSSADNLWTASASADVVPES